MIQTIIISEEVTTDYIPRIKDPLLRATCLLPWFPEPLPFDLNEEIPIGPPYPIVVQVNVTFAALISQTTRLE